MDSDFPDLGLSEIRNKATTKRNSTGENQQQDNAGRPWVYKTSAPCCLGFLDLLDLGLSPRGFLQRGKTNSVTFHITQHHTERHPADESHAPLHEARSDMMLSTGSSKG